MWFVTIMLFAPVGKQSNSRLQMFYKTDALRKLAIFTRIFLRSSFFLISLIKKILQHRCFPVNIAKCLSTAFLIEHLLFIKLFRNFMWWQNSLDVFGCKIAICHISCDITLFSFIALMLELEVHCYCCIYLVFIPKFLVSVTITRITGKAPSLFRLKITKVQKQQLQNYSGCSQ